MMTNIKYKWKVDGQNSLPCQITSESPNLLLSLSLPTFFILHYRESFTSFRLRSYPHLNCSLMPISYHSLSISMQFYDPSASFPWRKCLRHMAEYINAPRSCVTLWLEVASRFLTWRCATLWQDVASRFDKMLRHGLKRWCATVWQDVAPRFEKMMRHGLTRCCATLSRSSP